MGWKIKAQLMVGDEIAIGPGKADLLEAIADTGSISAAARAMALCYRRAWLMVDTMNRLFAEPLVLTVRGGPGGAVLSEFGQGVLEDYRRLQARLARSGTGIGVGLEGRLKAGPPAVGG